ncbi:MAG: S9 family peptidase [Tannerellaceae bacterium]|jgi:dipeptidyl aminopeptidase/acylaminoacyl peptidase|nr:S9 family peptidase [Tannerellaceae bacterium]
MDKTIAIISMYMSVLLAGACTQEKNQADDSAPLVGRPEVNVADGVMTPEVLYSLARVSDVKISPDGSKALYGVTFISIEQNKSNRELFVVTLDGTEKKQITQTSASEQGAVWVNGGKGIAFLSNESGSSQIWLMDADGSNRRQVSRHEGGVNGFILSPDETKILFFSDIKYGKSTSDIYPDLPKASGRIIDDLMYKHWDEWVETIPHPFVAAFDGANVGEAIDIMEGEPYECPMKPFSGVQDLAWSPDGKLIAYSCRKKTGVDYALSTNADIYLYDVETGKTRNFTEGMMGYDTAPLFSPDGKYIAWISQERDGYEADKRRLFAADLTTGERQYLTSGFDYDIDAIQWLPDSRSLYLTACKDALTHIWRIDADKQIRPLTSGQYDYLEMDAAAGKMVAVRQSMERASEVFAINTETGEATEISFENKHIFDRLKIAKSEPRWIRTTDGKQMLTWIIYPPDFDPSATYPALLYCQGGPQSALSQFWSYRWNMQIMAANGYIIVAPNRRGVPGFGQEWQEQISGDYGGQNMKDYFSAIDEMAREPYIDADRLGAVGASYGGFSVYWLAGNHQKRFKAFAAHSGIFNFEQQYLETEELWFANWDLGGPYWEKDNATVKRSFANSPHLFVDKWDTPILITHGERDYRILASQGMSAFNAAKLRGVPAKMMIFPDENHWITKPQNGVLFQRVFFDWLNKWLKP